MTRPTISLATGNLNVLHELIGRHVAEHCANDPNVADYSVVSTPFVDDELNKHHLISIKVKLKL